MTFPRGWQTWLPIAIACFSILSSVVSWQAARSAAMASGFASDAQRLEVEREQAQSELYAQVDHDRHLFPEWVAARETAARLRAMAARNPSDEDLAFRAQAEAQHARLLRQYFVASDPKLKDVVYNVDDVLKRYANQPAIQAADNALVETTRAARDERTRTSRLVKLVVGLLVATFFLTLARFSRDRWRRRFAAVGLAIALVGVAAFGWIGMFT
jgi:hypothetical protein